LWHLHPAIRAGRDRHGDAPGAARQIRPLAKPSRGREAVHALDSSLDAQLAPRERRWLTWLRRAGWTLVGLYFLVAVTMLLLRFWALPHVAGYKDEIAAAVSRALGEKVTIERVDAEWYGLHPRLELGGVRIHDRRGEEALELPYVGASIAWGSVVAGELRFKSLVLDRPELRIRRDPQGKLFIAGLELRPADGPDGGAADWVLEQGEIIIRDAQVEWRDEVRGAPPLKLERLTSCSRTTGATIVSRCARSRRANTGPRSIFAATSSGAPSNSWPSGTAGSTPRWTTSIWRRGKRGSTTRSRFRAVAARCASGLR
jgi:hypothetical protein